MLKLYEYEGFTFFFYSREHEPPHVHVKKSGRETRVKLLVNKGKIRLRIPKASAKKFTEAELNMIRNFVHSYWREILVKWRTFFDYGGEPEFQKVTSLKK